MFLDKSMREEVASTHNGTIIKEKPKKVYKEITETPEFVQTIEKVINWEKRIANYPLAIKNKYAQAFKKIELFFETLNEVSPEWKVIINNKKKGLYCEQRMSVRKLPVIRARGPSDYDALTTFRACGDAELRKQYDKNIQKATILKQVGCNFIMGY